MKKRTKQDMLLDVARKMPPLHHKLPDEDFNLDKSETLDWLLHQPEIKEYIWKRVANRYAGSRLIKYDPETGTWQGVDHDGD